MTVQHKAIANAELHEPKDVLSAAIGEVYKANGAGSGDWLPVGASNLVIVNSMSDFPAAISTVRTLVAGTLYWIGVDLTTTDSFVVSDKTSLTCGGVFGKTLEYTGTGTMFTGVDVEFHIFQASINCPNGKIFDISDTVGGVKRFICDNVAVGSCAAWGDYDDLAVINIVSSGTFSSTQGMTITGSNLNIVSLENFALTSTSASFVGIDFVATAVAPRIILTNCILSAPSGGIGIRGQTASANVPTGELAIVRDCEFTGGMTAALSGITEDDIRWDFQGNSPLVRDTFPDALLSMSANATDTILSVGVPTLVLGTFTQEGSSHFTTTTAGRATYNGERDLLTPMSATFTIDMVSGTNKSMRAYVAKNGTVIANSGHTVNISSGDPKQITIIWQDTASETNFYEPFIENVTDSVNATVIDCTFRLR